MELWEVSFFVLTLDFAFGKEISQTETYVVRKIDSCPPEGYFFKRDLSPNQVERGPCYLCFCRDHGTATCWQRDQKRCDVEKYHHHRVGRQSRYRRSFSDIFLRDASRDFFGKNVPQQCKPYEASFSDGCPPTDWCIGCTICDCDANGQWDCHILSFCDGKENKQKIKLKNQRKSRRRGKKSRKSLDYDYHNDLPPKKTTKKTTKKPTKKPTKTKPNTGTTTKTTKANAIKQLNANKVVKAKSGNASKISSKKAPKKPVRKHAIKAVTRKPRNLVLSQAQKKVNNVSKFKIIKKATRKPLRVNKNAAKGMTLNSNANETVKLGQKIVKQVMTTFKKMLAKEIEKLNETKRIKLDGKDCGEVKKRQKRTYNVRSNAITRKKNKFNKQIIKQEKYLNSRKKRHILNEEQATTENISVITLSTDVNAVIPLDSVKKENRSSTNLPVNTTTELQQSTSQKSHYYEYNIKSLSTEKSSALTEIVINVTKNIKAEIENISTTSERTLIIIPDKENKTDKKLVNHDHNDLKISKWYIIKVQNERKMPVTRVILPKPSTTKAFEITKLTNNENYTKLIDNFESKHEVTQKYNPINVHNPGTHKMTCCGKPSKKVYSSDVTGLKSIIQNIFAELNKKGNGEKSKHTSNISVLKYVRKFFQKIFSKKKNKARKIYGLGTKEDHTLQILCENIGQCRINRNSRMILKYKLKQLNNETKTVLRSIRTVKGLLRLLELPGSNQIYYQGKNNSFQNDIQKLGVVLKDYSDAEMDSSLTFAQKTQIDYIKKNTQTFIESVKKFSEILSDILDIITPNVDCSLPPQREYNRTMPLHKVRKLLYQYDIMQNTFMKRMYELIGGMEKTSTTTERLPNGRYQNNSNNIIENYAKNIIENLRKLKTIARVLSAKRQKRELNMKDNALDYLLMLMEMLISQSHRPLPAGDGIDLLLDAIKNAPDIKPINQKDWVNTVITESHEFPKLTNKYHNTDSESKHIANEEHLRNFENNLIGDYHVMTDTTVKLEKTTIPVNYDDDASDDVTQEPYFRRFNQPTVNLDEITTEYNTITNKRSHDELETKGLEKLDENYIGDPKKLEVEAVYLEDESAGDVIPEIVTSTIKTTNVIQKVTEKQIKHKTRIPKISTIYIEPTNESLESQEASNEKRSKLQWIEETFDREIRLMDRASNITSTTTTTKATTRQTPVVPVTQKHIDNVSDMTKEENVDDLKRFSKKPKHYNVLYEKQMQFLNSLDYYGTEKTSYFEEPDSKDVRVDDGFPAYFV